MNHYATDGRDLRAELAPYLHPDETLLWTGQPYTTRKFRPNPLVVVFMLFCSSTKRPSTSTSM